MWLLQSTSVDTVCYSQEFFNLGSLQRLAANQPVFYEKNECQALFWRKHVSKIRFIHMCLPLDFLLIHEGVLENCTAKIMLILLPWMLLISKQYLWCMDVCWLSVLVFFYWILFLCTSQIPKLSDSHHSHLENSEYSKTNKQLHQHDKAVGLHSMIE